MDWIWIKYMNLSRRATYPCDNSSSGPAQRHQEEGQQNCREAHDRSRRLCEHCQYWPTTVRNLSPAPHTGSLMSTHSWSFQNSSEGGNITFSLSLSTSNPHPAPSCARSEVSHSLPGLLCSIAMLLIPVTADWHTPSPSACRVYPNVC